NALNAPAWQATTPDLVPREELAGAVALGGISVNVARALGPALGGLLVAALGAGWVILLNAASFLGVVLVLARWHREVPRSRLPPEDVPGAMRAGVRYVRHSAPFRAVLARTAAFVVPASALWALLPLFARRGLGLSATGYGLLLGCLGAGAIVGAAFLPRPRERGRLRRRVRRRRPRARAADRGRRALHRGDGVDGRHVHAQRRRPERGARVGAGTGARRGPPGRPGQHGAGQPPLGRGRDPLGHPHGAGCGRGDAARRRRRLAPLRAARPLEPRPAPRPALVAARDRMPARRRRGPRARHARVRCRSRPGRGVPARRTAARAGPPPRRRHSLERLPRHRGSAPVARDVRRRVLDRAPPPARARHRRRPRSVRGRRPLRPRRERTAR